MSASIEFSKVLENIAGTFPSVYSIIGVVFVVAGLLATFSALLDLLQLSEPHKKYLGVHQPTGTGVIIKLFVAGFMMNFALSGQMANIISSMFFTDNTFDLVSIDTYVSDASETAVTKFSKIIVYGFMQAVGMVSIFKGLRIWSKSADRSSRETAWHGFALLVYGTLCMQFGQVLGVIQRTLGFDLFSLIGLA